MSEAARLAKLLATGKKFAVMMADDDDSPCVVTDWISTGCLALDAIMGGGLPVGRIVEMYGGTSSGKSLIAAQCAASAQELGCIVLMMDTERALSLTIAEAVGVDTSDLIYADPDTMEEAFGLMEETLLKAPDDTKIVIIWDSVAATTVEMEMNKDYGDATMGRHALVMSQGLRKFNRLIAKYQASAIFINQTRQKIGVMYGDDTATFGGKALPFYASIRIKLRSGQKIREGSSKKAPIVGIRVHAKIEKNKVAPPFKEAELPIYFGEGVDDAEATLVYLKELPDSPIKMSGSWSNITLGGKEHKFQKVGGWYKLFDDNYDEIMDIMEAV